MSTSQPIDLPGVNPVPHQESIASFCRDYLSTTGGIHLVAIRHDAEPTDIRAKFFGLNWEEAAIWATTQNAVDPVDVYFTFGMATVERKPKKADILGHRGFGIDIDPPRDGAWDKPAVLADLIERGKPSYVISTGRGFQAAFLTTETGLTHERVEQVNKGLSTAFGGDATHNVDRLYKLPGTVAWGNAKKRAAGYRPTVATIVVPFTGAVHTSFDLLQRFPAPAALVTVAEALPTGPRPEWCGPTDDDDLINIMLNQTPNIKAAFGEGATFRDLWEGKAEMLAKSYPDGEGFNHSQADAGLMAFLRFYTGADAARMERLFGMSALGKRDKWTTRPDYRAMTISRAIALGGDFYSNPKWATGGDIDWNDIVVKSDTGKLVPNLHTVLAIFRHHKHFKGRIKHNEMGHVTFVNDTRVDDYEISKLQEKLQGMGLVRVSKDTVGQALDHAAREHSYHPVRDYLNSLSWDGLSRVESLMTKYFVTDAGDSNELATYLAAVGRILLVSMVARVMEPGCKVDTMVILDGAQGIFKSTGLRVLAGDEYFSDALPDLSHNDKDASIHVADKWLIEIAELAAMGKTESKKTKQFISRQVEKYRAPYGRVEVVEPRQCVFAGTTNDQHYLVDDTGNRRYLPVSAISVDVEAIKRDRDQLFAEAVDMYKRGVEWWPSDEVAAIAATEADARFEADPWESIIAEYLSGQEKTTCGAVLIHLGIENAQKNKAAQNRVSKILRNRLGWKFGARTDGQKWLYPPE